MENISTFDDIMTRAFLIKYDFLNFLYVSIFLSQIIFSFMFLFYFFK
jgi:hypothetical protein